MCAGIIKRDNKEHRKKSEKFKIVAEYSQKT